MLKSLFLASLPSALIWVFPGVAVDTQFTRGKLSFRRKYRFHENGIHQVLSFRVQQDTETDILLGDRGATSMGEELHEAARWWIGCYSRWIMLYVYDITTIVLSAHFGPHDYWVVMNQAGQLIPTKRDNALVIFMWLRIKQEWKSMPRQIMDYRYYVAHILVFVG